MWERMNKAAVVIEHPDFHDFKRGNIYTCVDMDDHYDIIYYDEEGDLNTLKLRRDYDGVLRCRYEEGPVFLDLFTE